MRLIEAMVPRGMALMYRSIVFSLVALWAWNAYAQRPYTPTFADPVNELWRWREESLLDDLSVLCMDEAPDGSLWFGNVGSLAHYDGTALEVIEFDEDLLSRIESRKDIPWASQIKALDDGRILAYIGESLVLKDGASWKVIIEDAGDAVFTADLEQSADGTYWLSVPKRLWRIRADFESAELVRRAPTDGFFGAICIDDSGTLWMAEKDISTTAHLLKITSGAGGESNVERIEVPFDVDAREISLVMADDGSIWYADDSGYNYIYKFSPESGVWTPFEDAGNNRVFSLYPSEKGAIWASSQNELIGIFNDGSVRSYLLGHFGLPSQPASFFESSRDRLWLLGRIGYAFSLDIGTERWLTYRGLNFECEDSAGNWWFRSIISHAVVKLDRQTGDWTEYSRRDGLIDDIHAMLYSSHGFIWVAGQHEKRAAFAVYNGKAWRRYRLADFAHWIEPNSLIETDAGTIVMGAGGRRLPNEGAGGALEFAVTVNGEVEQVHRYFENKAPYFVTALENGPDGTAWVGSTFIYKLDRNARSIKKEVELRGLNTMDLIVDQNSNLWIAKENAGVYHYNGDIWRFFTRKDGLADHNVADLFELENGDILAANRGGISRFDGETWVANVFPQEMAMVRRWSGIRQTTDGSLWLNFNDREPPSPLPSFETQSDRFQSIRYNPEESPPETRIVSFLETVSQPGNTHIVWDARDPWSDTPREMIQYSWRLNGGAWSPFSSENQHTFVELERGQHRLEVRSRDLAFNIDLTPAVAQFYVEAPIWMRPWFIGVMCVFTVLTVALIVIIIRNRERYIIGQQEQREEHLRELDRVKTGFFTNISHELNTPLTLIVEPIKKVLRSEADPKKQKQLSMAMRNANRVSTLVGQIMDLQKLEMGTSPLNVEIADVSQVVKESVESLEPMAQMNDIALELDAGRSCRVKVDTDKLRKIVLNIVNNAIKYTRKEGRVCVTLQFADASADAERITIVVEDNGLGIEKEHLENIFDRYYRVPESSIVDGSGIGLNLTKELVSALGGDIGVESPIYEDPKKPGTRFTVSLTLARP
ncbi:MAG: ATP-binding protein [Opitutales bacterium]